MLKLTMKKDFINLLTIVKDLSNCINETICFSEKSNL